MTERTIDTDGAMQIKKHYDENPTAFIDHAEGSFTWQQVEAPAIGRVVTGLLDRGFTDTALDAACGSGRVTRLLRERGIPGGNIVGVDISVELIKKAIEKERQQEVGERMSFWAADLTNPYELDFALSDSKFIPGLTSNSYNKFGLVTSSMAFEFLDDEGVRKALRNLHGHMNEGGTLYIMTTHPTARARAHNLTDFHLRKHMPIPILMPWGTYLTNYHRPAEFFQEEIERAGLTVDSMEDLSVPTSAVAVNPELYQKYTENGPCRLGILAHKP